MTTETIDITPSWESTAQMCMVILSASGSEEAKKVAREELTRMARGYDQLIEFVKNMSSEKAA